VIIGAYVDAATLLPCAVAAALPKMEFQYKTEFSSRKKIRVSEVETEPVILAGGLVFTILATRFGDHSPFSLALGIER
jgi:hypothetical protein